MKRDEEGKLDLKKDQNIKNHSNWLKIVSVITSIIAKEIPSELKEGNNVFRCVPIKTTWSR